MQINFAIYPLNIQRKLLMKSKSRPLLRSIYPILLSQRYNKAVAMKALEDFRVISIAKPTPQNSVK